MYSVLPLMQFMNVTNRTAVAQLHLQFVFSSLHSKNMNAIFIAIINQATQSNSKLTFKVSL